MGNSNKLAPGKMPSTQSELVEVCSSTLRESGWQIQRNLALAPSPKGGQLRTDILGFHKETGKRVAVFPRWQASLGTAEEKIPFQIMKFEMAVAARPDCADAAYFVLEGNGWTWREFYLSPALMEYLPRKTRSKCVRLETFYQLALTGTL